MKYFLLILIAMLIFAGCKEDNVAGPNIDDILPPVTSVRIDSVRIDLFPTSDPGGVGYDFGSGPDLFFVLTDSADAVIASFRNDRTTDLLLLQLPYTMKISTVYKMNLGKTYFLTAYDADSPDADDYMNYLYGFKPNSLATGTDYPAFIDRTSPGDNLKARIYLTWLR